MYGLAIQLQTANLAVLLIFSCSFYFWYSQRRVGVGHVTRSCKGPCCKRWIYSPSGRKLLVSSFRLSWATTTLLTAPKFWVFLDTKFAIDLLIIKSICTYCAFCCFQNWPMPPMIRSAPNIFHRKCVSFECLACSVLWILSDVRKQSPFQMMEF